MTISTPVARALQQRVSRAPSPVDFRQQRIAKLLVELRDKPFTGQEAVAAYLQTDPDHGLARALVEHWIAKLGVKPVETIEQVACYLVPGYHAWNARRDQMLEQMVVRGTEELLSRLPDAELDELDHLNRDVRRAMYAPACREIAHHTFLDQDAGVEMIKELFAGHPATKRVSFDDTKLTAALLERALLTLDFTAHPRGPVSFVLSTAGGMMLAGAAPDYEDKLFQWIMPNVRAPKGARKPELNKLWEHMITGKQKLRRKPLA